MFTCCLYWSKAVLKLAHETFAWNMVKTTVSLSWVSANLQIIWKAILNKPSLALPPTFMGTSSSGIAFSHVNLPL